LFSQSKASNWFLGRRGNFFVRGFAGLSAVSDFFGVAFAGWCFGYFASASRLDNGFERGADVFVFNRFGSVYTNRK